MQPAALVYHDRRFMPLERAALGVQDRGVLFADGVYEVVRYDKGRAFAMRAHVQRLRESLAGIGLELPGELPGELAAVSDELVRRNGLVDAKVYWQVTRGPQPRDFVMPPPPPDPESPPPSVTLIAYPARPLDPHSKPSHGPAIVVEDIRWTRCWIKSLMLLPASLARTRAHKAGAIEAVFERSKPPGNEGVSHKHMTEGSASNLFIVRGNELQTHPLDGWVLPGVTRRTLLDLAPSLNLVVVEKPFTQAEMLAADEVFVCSTTQLTALTSFEGQPVAGGGVGDVTRRLHTAYLDAISGHSG